MDGGALNTPEALYRAITTHGSKMDSEKNLGRTLAELERAYGSASAAARQLDIPRRTWRRWKAGEGTPKPDRLGVLKSAIRRVRLSATRERFLRGHPHIVVDAYVRISSDERPRKMLISGWPDRPGRPPITGMMNDVLDQWLQGRDMAAADAFVAPIDGGVDGDLTLVDVKAIRFFGKRSDALAWSMRP